MSKLVKAKKALVALVVASTVLVLTGTVAAEPPKMEIDPIAGLTTGRHVAPANMTLPPGTVLQLRQPRSSEGPSPSDPAPRRIIDDDDSPEEGVIVWSGVDISFEGVDASIARFTLTTLGQHVVTARFVDYAGATLWENTSTINVADVPFSSIEVEPQETTVAALATDENLTNEDTMRLFFDLESIADLHWVAGSRPGDGITSDFPGVGSTKGGTRATLGRFVTSNRRTVSFGINVNPSDCSSLVEWRVDGKAVGLGSTLDHRFDSIGVHTVSVGPPGQSREILVETYDVTITSHTPGVDIILQGEPVIFEAVTNPPGYEDYIVWVSSTKYGTASPDWGFGRTFTALFENTYGNDAVNGLWRWIGVKADSTTLGQDQKPIQLCKGGCDCGGDCEEVEYGADVGTQSADLHVWDNTCKAGGHKNVGELIQAICDKFDANNSQQIKVFVDGHGCSGEMSVGAGTTAGTDPANNTATVISSNNAAWFGDQIKDKVTTIVLFGCEVGADQTFLDTVSTDNSVLEVKAYNQIVCTNDALTTHEPTVGATLKCSNP